MKETVCNIFIFSKDGIHITHTGIVPHQIDNDDDDDDYKLEFLLKN